jgi:bifunctional DNA-binding transcriptional regulator/antitoxin component of YhaV-PrlF toxin-antitoxin module
MRATGQVNQRGQITLDPEVRRALGVKPGMVTHQRVVGDRLEIIFVPGPHRQSRFGALADYRQGPLATTGETLEGAVQEAVIAEVATWRDADV